MRCDTPAARAAPVARSESAEASSADNLAVPRRQQTPVSDITAQRPRLKKAQIPSNKSIQRAAPRTDSRVTAKNSSSGNARATKAALLRSWMLP
eukprot:CAMPEP_0204199864 /NCGR_PEP_ID=MMETSP0361-20130328/66318_1 /ASSEMBLY_ACC=CAM_ASM_000343 /TAXON_ID=268821 /ORGANISM="Scrippsiella Hangoei, Strain SHTV-5" /LENGTH=93 /DNA_ID=CAMNT_0051162221 /DNA_START=116 /DNA_END=393 /DNA_ORIENTATION=+